MIGMASDGKGGGVFYVVVGDERITLARWAPARGADGEFRGSIRYIDPSDPAHVVSLVFVVPEWQFVPRMVQRVVRRLLAGRGVKVATADGGSAALVVPGDVAVESVRLAATITRE